MRKSSVNKCFLLSFLFLAFILYTAIGFAEPSASERIYVYNQGRSKADTDGQDDIRALRLDWGTDPAFEHYHYGVRSTDTNKSGWNYLGNIPDPSKSDGENYGSGCGLYVQAHAIQWLNQRPTSNPKGLMEELIAVCNSPWDGASNGSYNALICAKTGATCEKMSVLDEDRMTSILSSGGCITLNIPGHYILGPVQKLFIHYACLNPPLLRCRRSTCPGTPPSFALH